MIAADNLPLIRYAESTQTIPMEQKGIVHRISQTLLDSPEATIIDLSTQTLPHVITIEQGCINKTLLIPKEYTQPPYFFSFIKYYNPYHYIAKIDAQGCILGSLLASFLKNKSSNFPIFWEIKAITAKDHSLTDIIFSENRTENSSEAYNIILGKDHVGNYFSITWKLMHLWILICFLIIDKC